MPISQKQLVWWLLSAASGVVLGILAVKLLPLFSSDTSNPVLQTLGVRKPAVIGFVPFWLLDSVEPLSLETLDTITYFGLTLAENGELVKQTNPQEAEPGWRALEIGKFSELVADNSVSQLDRSLLVHLSDEQKIAALLTQPTQHAATMMEQVEPLMKQYQFTDLNIDIESFRTASSSSQASMSAFLREVRKQMDQRQLGTLTVEIAPAALVRELVLVPEVVGEVSDRVVLMAYDYYYSGSPITGPVAPLRGAKDKWQYDITESVKLAVQAMPAEKVYLGIPSYGYEWETLTNQPQSPVIPGTNKTATTRRVSELLKDCPGCVMGRDEAGGSPYLILPPNDESAFQQIYYEDEASIEQKMELAKAYKLGGVAIWALGYENSELLDPVAEYRTSLIERD